VSLANKTTLDLADIILERWLMYKTKNKRPCSRVLNIQILHTQPEYGLYLTLCDIGIFRDYELDTPPPPQKKKIWKRTINSYPANVENMVSPNNASRWQMGFNSAFNPYPANVENMVSS
jgi:hypothetical protein